MKQITVKLEQQSDGSYCVRELINSCKLTIGQTVSAADVAAYCACAQITVRITGAAVEQQSNPLADKPKRRKSVSGQTQLSIAS